MADTISIDKEALQSGIETLNNIINSNDLMNSLVGINSLDDILSTSVGQTKDEMIEINSVLNDINTNVQLLVQRTIDFLSNTYDNFVEVDETLANDIEKMDDLMSPN